LIPDLEKDQPRKVTVGLGTTGLFAQMEMKGGFLRRIARWFLPRSIAEVQIPLPGSTRIHAPEPDQGTIHVTIQIANLSRRDFLVDDVVLDWVRLGQGNLESPHARFVSLDTHLRPRSVSPVYFDITMKPVDLRNLHRTVGKAGNLYSSPRAHIDIRGFFRLKQRGRDHKCLFFIEGINPKVVMFENESRGSS